MATRTEDLAVIGKSLPMIDAYEKVTGKLKYAGDLPNLQRMHHAKVLRSPYAHARITKLDTSVAEAMAGVSAVITYADGNKAIGGGPACGPIWTDPSFNFRGPILSNEPCFVGDEVAAVSAVDEETAKEALATIEGLRRGRGLLLFRNPPLFQVPIDCQARHQG